LINGRYISLAGNISRFVEYLKQHAVVHVEFCRSVHGMFKEGTPLGISFIVSELVHFVSLECGTAGAAGEQVLRSVCGAKELAVTERCSYLPIEECCYLSSFPDIIMTVTYVIPHNMSYCSTLLKWRNV